MSSAVTFCIVKVPCFKCHVKCLVAMVTIRLCNCETRWIFAFLRHEPGLLKTMYSHGLFRGSVFYFRRKLLPKMDCGVLNVQFPFA